MKSILILILFLTPFSSFSAEENSVERIQVTGSRIKRINIEGSSPLLILEKEDLENSGYNSVADVLRDTSIAPFGLRREESGSSVSGESFGGVHGASALILINGQRVITDPNAEAVDLHLIPIYAVERIEIIKDGSSAIYGSDALGGVINFIMKENLSGQEIFGRVSPTLYPIYKGGSRLEGSTTWGNTYTKGSMTGVLQFRFNDGILSSDRKWSAHRVSGVSIHPVFRSSNKTIVISESCPPESNKKTYCEFNYTKYSTSIPTISQLSTYLQGSYKWNGINLYSQLLSSYKRTKYHLPPIPNDKIPLGVGHKMSVQTGIPGLLSHRFKESGNRKMLTDYFVADTAFGAKGYLSSNWDWDLSMKISGTYKKNKNEGLLLKKQIYELLHEGIYDPFTTDKRDLKEAIYTSKNNNSSLLLLTDLVFSGNIGSIDTAIGAQGYYTNYKENTDPQARAENILSNAGSDGSGSRKVGSFFGEMSYSPIDSLEIQVAGRGDYYFDLNKLVKETKKLSNGVFTFNPKASFRFQPVNSFLLRASVGQSFIAPSLHSLYGTKSEGFPYLIDSVACFNELKTSGDLSGIDETLAKEFILDQKETIEKKGLKKEAEIALGVLAEKLTKKHFCTYRQYHAEIKQNSKLKETKGISASIGSVIQVNDNTSFTLDGWYIKTNGSPSYGISNDTIKVELKKGSDFVAKHGIIINRDSTKDHNPILNSRTNGLPGIDSKLVNISSAELSGLDFSLSTFFPNLSYRGGNFYLKEEGVIILHSKSEGFPGRGFKDVIGKAGIPRWRNISTLGWQNKRHNLSLKVNSFASVTKSVNELESLPMHHRLDLSYQWAMDSKTIINSGWINILFNDPPIDDSIKSASQIDTDLYEVRGPHFFVGFKKLL